MDATTAKVDVRELLSHLALKLPSRIFVDPNSLHGKFVLEFLRRLTDSQLKELRTKCKKLSLNPDGMKFLFYADGPDSHNCTDFSLFDWNKSVRIDIGESADTLPVYITLSA